MVSSPALRPAQCSSEAPIQDDRRHWPLQYASYSWILGRVSFTCISQCTSYSLVSRGQPCGHRRVTFQQAFNLSPTCFAVSLLSPLTSCQVPAPRATFAEAPSFAVCSARVVPRDFVFHQHFSRGARHHLCGPLHSDLDVECSCHCHLSIFMKFSLS